MKTSTSTWDKNKKASGLVVLKPGEYIARLFCCLLPVVLSSCIVWPAPAERVLSMPEERQVLPKDLTREYLKGLLEITELRYAQLISVGGDACIPGQMLKISRLHNLVKHEIDGNLFFDARNNMGKTFSDLANARNMIEDPEVASECFHSFQLGHRGSNNSDYGLEIIPELPDWSTSEEVRKLMRSQ